METINDWPIELKVEWIESLLLHGWIVQVAERQNFGCSKETRIKVVKWIRPDGISGCDYESLHLMKFPEPVKNWILEQPSIEYQKEMTCDKSW